MGIGCFWICTAFTLCDKCQTGMVLDWVKSVCLSAIITWRMLAKHFTELYGGNAHAACEREKSKGQ